MTKIFDIVPGWLYAIGLAMLLALLGVDSVRIANGKANLAALQSAVAQQKAAASAELAAVTASVLAQQKTLDSIHATQEKTDASNVQTVDGAQGNLHSALDAHGGRLCNSAPRRGGSSGSAAGAIAADAVVGAADTAQASGILQPNAQRLLERLTHEADQINIAYASCKADAQTVRGQSATASYELPLGGKLQSP